MTPRAARRPPSSRSLRLAVTTAATVLALAALATACRRTPPPLSAEFARASNLGKAYLENRDADKALAAFGRAAELAPESAPALRNLARAELLARKHDEALATLERARKLDPDSPATAYLSGLAYARESRFAEAIPRFEEAVRLDPGSAPLRFQLAGAYEATDQRDKAVEQLRETVRLDPLHASAHFKLATAARLAGDRETFDREQREFMHLRELQGDEARSAEALEASVYTHAEPATAPPPPSLPASTPVTFVDATETLPAPVRDATAAAVLEVDPTGRPTLVVALRAGGLALLLPAAKGAFAVQALEVPGLPAGATQLLVGDFHDEVPPGVTYDPAVHAHNDVLLIAPAGARLLERTAAGGFADVTERAGLGELASAAGAPAAALWVDADQDGDLDLLTGSAGGLRFFQNRGDGTFVDAGAALGIVAAGPVADLAAGDLDGNGAIDLVEARGLPPTQVLVNQRAATFAPLPDPPGPWPSAGRVLLGDIDDDGAPEALLVSGGGATVVRLGSRGRVRLDLRRGEARAVAAVLFDFDNDGWLDLAVASAAGELQLWRHVGAAGYSDATDATGLAALVVPAALGRRSLVAADFDGDGDTDLLIATGGGLRLLENRGGEVHRQLKLRLVGTKTNPTGIGTHVEVRAGTFLVSREVTGPTIEIGVGDHRRLDSVQTVWTNGVVDNQLDVDPAAGPLTVVEKVVATGSCPFLYAWDGKLASASSPTCSATRRWGWWRRAA